MADKTVDTSKIWNPQQANSLVAKGKGVSKVAQTANDAEIKRLQNEITENDKIANDKFVNPKTQADARRLSNEAKAKIAHLKGNKEEGDRILQEQQVNEVEEKGWLPQEDERAKLAGEGERPEGSGVKGVAERQPVEQPEVEPKFNQNFADYITSKPEGSGNRDYLIADSIAKFLRNTGKDIGNVAAAYSGGTMNNDRETSLLEDRLAQRAQAETEEGIKSDFANSKLGQSLRMGAQEITANDITNANRSDQRAWGKAMIARFFDENGKLKPGADKSPDFQNMVTLANQVISGGGQVDNVVTAFFKKIMQGLSEY